MLIAAVGWLLLSFISFAISAQIQKGKLPQSAKDALKGGPAVLAGQNILILGGDRRGKTQHNASGSEGQGPPRADTIMVLHASLTSFRKLSIPRDSYAAIPNCGEQKINASLACNTRSTERQSRGDDQDRRELPRDRHQPHRDRRLRRLRRASSTRSAG